jgi:hypothetical protein
MEYDLAAAYHDSSNIASYRGSKVGIHALRVEASCFSRGSGLWSSGKEWSLEMGLYGVLKNS